MMKKKTPHDFKFIRALGEGSFSSVYLAVDARVTRSSLGISPESNIEKNQSNLSSDKNESGIDIGSDSIESTATATAPAPVSTTISTLPKKKISKYAIKVCQKIFIKKMQNQKAIMREKEILNVLNQHPNNHFIKLYYTFQDTERLYFVMTYAESGDLLSYMKENPLSLKLVRKYTSQLVEALEHLHRLNIVHRDLKPENILLNSKMDIMLTDFGSAQIYPNINDNKDNDNGDEKRKTNDSSFEENETTRSTGRRNSFVGTAQYVSPEMLKNHQASNKSDLWSLGVVICQMITNVMPFDAPNEYLTYQKILNIDSRSLEHLLEGYDSDARDLVFSLIKLIPNERLGANDDLKKDGYISIKKHKFLSVSGGGAEPLVENGSPVHIDEDLSLEDDPDLKNVDEITPGLDETQIMRMFALC